MYYLLTSKQKVAIKAVYKLHEGFRLCDSNPKTISYNSKYYTEYSQITIKPKNLAL